MTTHTPIATLCPSRWAADTLDLVLASEDASEEALRLAPDDRTTCPLHRKWLHQCVASPAHVNSVTRHRWCRRCACPLTVSVDEVVHTVSIRCPRCGDGDSPATRRMIAACRNSLAASRERLPLAS